MYYNNNNEIIYSGLAHPFSYSFSFFDLPPFRNRVYATGIGILKMSTFKIRQKNNDIGSKQQLSWKSLTNTVILQCL